MTTTNSGRIQNIYLATPNEVNFASRLAKFTVSPSGVHVLFSLSIHICNLYFTLFSFYLVSIN